MSSDLEVFTVELGGSSFGRGNMPIDPLMSICGRDTLPTAGVMSSGSGWFRFD